MSGAFQQLRMHMREALDRIAETPAFEHALRGAFSHASFFPTFRNSHQMILVMREMLGSDSCCVDIGANKGLVLHHMLRFSPEGEHVAIEPLPEVFHSLKTAYAGKGNIDFHNVAVTDHNSESDFFFVKACPTVSGLRPRMYLTEEWDVEKIRVPVMRLDDILASKKRVDFIKIDVEGAEEGVLRGGEGVIWKHRPSIVFEHNFHAAPYFNTTAAGLYDFLVLNLDMRVTTLGRWLARQPVLMRRQFVEEFDKGQEQDYLAVPRERLEGRAVSNVRFA